MSSIWPANALTGGGTGALDAIDGGLLSDGDGAVVIAGTTAYFYSLDADSAVVESSPDVIAPDTNAGDKRWILQDIGGITTTTDTHTDVSQAGSLIVPNVSDINFTSSNDASFSVADDGDGSVTVTVSTIVPVDSVAGKTGTVSLVASDVGLENVPNVDATIASNVDITDSGGYFTGTEVETALQEDGERSVYADSPGIITGGKITEGTNAETFKSAALTAYVRSTNSPTGALVKISLAEQDNQSIPSADTTYYALLDYNGGSPQIVTSTTNPYAEGTDYTQIPVGKVMKETDGTVHFISGGYGFQDGVQKLHQRAVKLRGFELANGSAIAYQATDEFTMTTGLAQRGANAWDLPSYDSGLTQFTAIHSDGAGGWTEADRNTINTDYYDDGSGALQEIGNNRNSVHWIFRHTDDGHIFARYGTDSYKLAEAEVAQLPTVPDYIDDFGLLIGKIIAPKGGGSFTAIQMVTDTVFIGVDVSDHGSMGGLDDPADHPWAVNNNEFTQDSGILVGTGAGTFQEETGATARTSLGLGTAATHDDSEYEPADNTILKEADVDDTPVDGITAAPVSSNWAYDHEADTSVHHTKYTDAEAETAINNDADHGSTASHDYASIPSDVGLGNVPNEDATDMTNWDQKGATSGQAPIWDGAQWTPSDVGGAFPSGTKMLFKQSSAPTGWTFVSEDNDRVILNTSTEADGGVTGGDWQLPNVNGHAIIENEMPSHNHGGSSGYGGGHNHSVRCARNWGSESAPAGYYPGNDGNVQWHDFTDSTMASDMIASVGNHKHSISVGSAGGDSSHNHSQGNSWRPSYAKVITCTKD